MRVLGPCSGRAQWAAQRMPLAQVPQHNAGCRRRYPRAPRPLTHVTH